MNAKLENNVEAQAETSSKWVLVWVLAVAGMLNYGVRTSVTAVYPLLKTELGFSDLGLGALGSFFLWSYALASPAAGYLGDRLDRSRVVLWSLIGWSVVTAASGMMTARAGLLAMRLLLGLVESLFLPAATALIAEYHTAKTRATAMGAMGVGQYVGLIGGTTLVGFLADHYGWRAPFWVLGCAGLLAAIPTYALLPVKKRATRTTEADAAKPRTRPGPAFAEALLSLLKVPSFLVLAAAGALTSISTWIFLNWLPLYFKEAYAMSLAGAGFFGATFINGSGALAQVLGGVLSDQVARRGAHRRMLLQALLILAAAPTLLVFISTRNLAVIVAALVLNAGLRIAGDLNILPLLCDLAGEDKLAIAFGVTNMLNCLAGGAGIFVAGLLKSRLGLGGIFAATLGCLVLDATMLLCCYGVFLRKDLEKAATRVAVGV